MNRHNLIVLLCLFSSLLLWALVACSQTEVASIAPQSIAEPTEGSGAIEADFVAADLISAETPRISPTPSKVSPTQTPPTALSNPIDRQVADLLAQMTLAEKIAQMALVEKNSIEPSAVRELGIGGILSGGANGYPEINDAENWLAMTTGYHVASRESRLGIPILYGTDAIHGHNNLRGATIFPHNIGLGATRDADLVKEIGRLTAFEAAATGINWNLGPVVAVPQDIRWGRTYESYSENTALVGSLGTAFLEGLQNRESTSLHPMLATPKHFVADGGTIFGSSTIDGFLLDQGNVTLDEATLRRIHLPPYEQAIEAGARSIMVSYSSWRGIQMHARTDLVTFLLKDELGFTGFVVSDWAALDQIGESSYEGIVVGVNAGIDMVMVPYDYAAFLQLLTEAVANGDVPESRIDDAVSRILRVKSEMNLFEQLPSTNLALAGIGSPETRTLARHAVRQSLVLLKNDNQTLPLSDTIQTIFVAGEGADDIGIQSGGWTIDWQGGAGDITEGTTILEGIEQRISAETTIHYDKLGIFERVVDENGERVSADIGIAVVGERPYAEGLGDSADIALTQTETNLIRRMGKTSDKVIVILVTGRPLIITDLLDEADAWVVAWLPGSEGAGVADVLFGDNLFNGKLPFSWPRSAEQLPFNFTTLPSDGCEAPLFPFGYGLSTLKQSRTDITRCEAE